jgi:hypothetical protein
VLSDLASSPNLSPSRMAHATPGKVIILLGFTANIW